MPQSSRGPETPDPIWAKQIEEKEQSVPEIPHLFGSHSVMIEVAVILSGGSAALADFGSCLLLRQCVVGFWKNTSGQRIAALKAKLAIKAR